MERLVAGEKRDLGSASCAWQTWIDQAEGDRRANRERLRDIAESWQLTEPASRQLQSLTASLQTLYGLEAVFTESGASWADQRNHLIKIASLSRSLADQLAGLRPDTMGLVITAGKQAPTDFAGQLASLAAGADHAAQALSEHQAWASHQPLHRVAAALVDQLRTIDRAERSARSRDR